MTPYRPRSLGKRNVVSHTPHQALDPKTISEASENRSAATTDILWWLQLEGCQDPGWAKLTERIVDSLEPAMALSLYRNSQDYLGRLMDWAMMNSMGECKMHDRVHPSQADPDRPWLMQQVGRVLRQVVHSETEQVGVSMDWTMSWGLARLSEHRAACIANATAALAKTRVSLAICEALNKAILVGGVSVILGAPSTGRGFAAAQWCRQIAGRARWFTVPPGQDVQSLARAFALCLGDPAASTASINEIECRFRELVASERFVFVLDSAERLWPENPGRKGRFARIEWLVSVFNEESRSSLVLIGAEEDWSLRSRSNARPQSSSKNSAAEKDGPLQSGTKGDNSIEVIRKLTASVAQVIRLPSRLSLPELKRIAQVAFPSASDEDLTLIASITSASKQGLGAFSLIARTALGSARRAGRNAPNEEDFTAGAQAAYAAQGGLQRLEGGVPPTHRGARGTAEASVPPRALHEVEGGGVERLESEARQVVHGPDEMVRKSDRATLNVQCTETAPRRANFEVPTAL